MLHFIIHSKRWCTMRQERYLNTISWLHLHTMKLCTYAYSLLHRKSSYARCVWRARGSKFAIICTGHGGTH